MHKFELVTVVFGGLLIIGALGSGIARRSFLAMTGVFVLLGLALGRGGLEILDFDPASGFVTQLATVALIVILFRDGLEVEGEMLRKAWRLPLRKLIFAMPITAALIAGAVKLLTDLSWVEAFLLGALLSPTDPVLSSSVVTNPKVPRKIRHSLNLESGLNDGLALPAVLVFVAALSHKTDSFVWYEFVIQDLGLGLVYGLICGVLGSTVMPKNPRGRLGGIPDHHKALYLLGIAFGTYGVTVLRPHGNGLIAVFVCAIVIGVRRPDLRRIFAYGAEEIVEIVKLGVFVVFGSLLTLHGLFTDGWAALAIAAFVLLLARPIAIAIALIGTKLDIPTKAFMAWFGPKGVATMTFSLLVLSHSLTNGHRIFNLAALTVMLSIIAHGVTDTAGAEWIGRRGPKTV